MQKWLIFIATVFFISGYSGEELGTSFFQLSSTTFTQIAEKSMPATVYLKVQVIPKPTEQNDFFNSQGDDFFRRYGQPSRRPPAQPQIANGGSGFLISSDGYIVTNFHVIKDAVQITVILNDGREFPASVKGVDSRVDIALIKIEENDLPFLTFGDSDSLKVGEWVIAIGNPFGLEATLTVGVVSAKGRQDIGIASYEDFIQTDASINPGNSGGPLLNLQNQVIGVNTALFSSTGGYVGIGFSIPSKMVELAVDQLMEFGEVKRAYLGVTLLPAGEGLLISEIMENSPAALGGLQLGDIIVQWNDKGIKNVTKFRNDIAMMSPGSNINLKILRNQMAINLIVNLGMQSDAEAISTEILRKMGIEIATLTDENRAKYGLTSKAEGVLVTKVVPISPAWVSGIRANFLITGIALSVNSVKKIETMTDLENELKEVGDKRQIFLVTGYQNSQRYYTINLY